MSQKRWNKPPAYRLHKASGQAVVSINGRVKYLGKYGSAASREKYARIIAEMSSTGGCVTPPSAMPQSQNSNDVTVAMVMATFLQWARGYYRKGTRQTSEYGCICLAITPVIKMYGSVAAVEFGPAKLMAVRESMIQVGNWSRETINGNIHRIRRAFKHAASYEILPMSVYNQLCSVMPLRAGRDQRLIESPPVSPVSAELVDAIKPHVSSVVWAMVQLQQLTGMRSGEVVIMRTGDIQQVADDVCIYRPDDDKMAHRRAKGEKKLIAIGPRARSVILPFLRIEDPDAFIFSAAESKAELLRRRNEKRVTPAGRGNYPGSRKPKRRPSRAARDHFDSKTYGRSIRRACDAASEAAWLKLTGKDEIEPAEREEFEAFKMSRRWHPHQLRHGVGTEVASQFDLETARAVLGHRNWQITRQYAELDAEKAKAVARKIG